MNYVRVPVPRIPPGLGTNLLGAAGLVAIVAAIAALASWKWGLLAAGVFAVALTMVAQYQQSDPVGAGAAEQPAAPAARSRIEAEAERVVAEARQQLDAARAEATR